MDSMAAVMLMGGSSTHRSTRHVRRRRIFERVTDDERALVLDVDASDDSDEDVMPELVNESSSSDEAPGSDTEPAELYRDWSALQMSAPRSPRRESDHDPCASDEDGMPELVVLIFHGHRHCVCGFVTCCCFFITTTVVFVIG